MANFKKLQAALAQKQADLDKMDDQIMGMPEMAPDAPDDMGTSPDFDLLTEKREELEEEIRHMREGVELISQWDKFKGGPWSEDIQKLLGEIDVEIADIAGGDVASDDAGLPMDMGADMGMGAPPDMGAPPLDATSAAPPMDAAAPAAPTPEIPAAEPAAEPAPIEPPMASVKAGKPQAGKKNSYQVPVQKGIARSDINKEGSNMATPTPAKASVQGKLADIKTKREGIRREAQQRVAAAWTIAKTMLPTAPAVVQKAAASNLLQNPTNVLNAMLRQTAKNAHYSKLAESVHKKTMNDPDLMEEPSVLASERSAVEKEIKGEAKSAAKEKQADDRKDSGPQTSTYSDGRGAGGGKHTEPKQMDAGSSSSQTEAANRPENTINKSEGDGKVSSKAAAPKVTATKAVAQKAVAPKATAPKKAACGKDCKGCEKCEKKAAEKCSKCEGECKCAAAESKHAGHKPDCDCNFCDKSKKEAARKTADPITDAPAEAPPMDMPPGVEGEALDEAPVEEGLEEAPAEEMPLGEEDMDAEADTAGEVISDEKKMIVEENIEEVKEAIKSLEQELLVESEEELDLSQMEQAVAPEGEEELDLSQVFNEDEMEEKVSALANEDDEHTAADGLENYFAPSAAESMEASLDEPQMASMEDFFSLRGSDSDPLAHLIAGEIKSAADVAGFSVVESMTGDAAKHFESDTATGENRDNENDHDGDLFAEAIEDQKPEDGGFKRVKQDETNVLQEPKAAKSKVEKKKDAAPVIKKLKNVTAAAQKPVDIASALLGDDEF